MRVPLGDLAQLGINKDLQDYALPVGAWTDARNVRFQDGKLVRFTGHLAALRNATLSPHWGMHVFSASGNSHWIVAGLDKVHCFTSGAYSDISKAATTYTAIAERLWNGGQLGNVPIINNGSEVPQMWSPVSAAQRLVDLTNWPGTHRAAVLKPYKNFLFALDLTISAARFPHRVLISHPAQPGGIPASWDVTDLTKDVYTTDIGDPDSGFLIDCAPMRDFNVLYKERSTHGAQFIGGRDKWRIFPIFTESGLFSQHCVVPFAENSMHAVMSGDDVIIHNGQTPQRILNERLRRWFFSNIDITNYARSFAVHNQQETEVWFCIPLTGSEWCNLAMVWNYSKNSITFRDLPQLSFINGGVIPVEVDDPWDSDGNSWDSDQSRWDSFTHPPFIRRLLGFKPGADECYHLDFTDQFDEVNFEASIEKFGLDVIGVSRSGEIIRDREMMRFVKRLFIQAKGSPFNVQLGTQQEIEGPISWSTPEQFIPGTDKFVDFEDSVATQLFGIRISSTAPGAWEISGIDVDVEPAGAY